MLLFPPKLQPSANSRSREQSEWARPTDLGLSSWRRALAHLLDHRAEFIDLALGRSESIQITQNLRRNPAYEATMIVGLASEDEAAPEKLSEFGFSEAFKKPFDIALLGERIRSLAEAKRETY